MFKVISILVIALSSCITRTEKGKSTSESSPIKIGNDESKTLEQDDRQVIDLKKLKFKVNPQSDTPNFKGVNTAFFGPKIEEENYLNDSIAKRKGDTLIIQLENGKNSVFTNYTPNGEESFTNTSLHYEYRGTVDKFSQIAVLSYEYSWVILLNRINGDTTHAIGKITAVPNSPYFLAANADIESRYTTNGFQLYEKIDGILHAVAICEFYTWGPEFVHWKSSHELEITASKLGRADNNYNLIHEKLQLTRLE